MTTLDQFQSLFKSADKAVFHYRPVTFARVLVVTDLPDGDARTLVERLRGFLAVIDRDGIEWDHLAGDAVAGIQQLLDAVAARSPDLIVTYRHLHSDAWRWPHGLGAYLDVLTQATDVPVLVIPHPDAGRMLPHGLTDTDRVMAMTDHLTGDDRLVNNAVALTAPGGHCWLTHVESSRDLDRYMAAIERIPAIDTDTAREMLREQLLKEPHDYILFCRAVIEAVEGLDIHVEELVTVGSRLSEYRRLVEAHGIDLLIMYTKDEDQLAMHGVAYPLAVGMTQIPLLML